MRYRLLFSALVTVLSVSLVSPLTYALPSAQRGSVGYDVSWPNCHATPPKNTWGIIGVTGGLDFTPNPCAYNESVWFNSYGLYMNTGYPGPVKAAKYANFPKICKPSNNVCLAYNYGYNAAKYALNYASLQDVHANSWWLDVETVNSWSDSIHENRAVLQGMEDLIKASTLLSTVGFYSTTFQWQTITGGWNNPSNNWVATGGNDLTLAKKSCVGNNFTNGRTILTQYTSGLDKDYVCSSNYPF